MRPREVLATTCPLLRSLIGILPLLLGGSALAGSTSALDAIKQRYDEVQKSAKDKESYYLHEININSNRKDAPAVGNFGKQVTYYMNEPDGPFTSVWDAIPVKVRVRTIEADREYVGEYIYSERGRLIFVFEKDEHGERRYYLNGSKLIRVIKEKQINDAPNQAQAKVIQKQAAALLALLPTINRALP